MKKLLILSAVFALSACACFNGDEPAQEAVVYQNVQARPQNCDYYDGKTCYRYVRRVHQAPVVRYREPRPVMAPVVAPAVSCPCRTASCGCQSVQYAAPACGGCAPQVSETREPVEVVYKKTTYTTTYQPNTTAAVSYERAPYSQEQAVVPAALAVATVPAVSQAPVEIVTSAPASVEVVAPADKDEEILLNVK